jgi:hypothetical protein
VVWGTTRAEGAELSFGIWLTGLGAVLGVGAGILTLRDAPVGGPVEDEIDAPVAAP